MSLIIYVLTYSSIRLFIYLLSFIFILFSSLIYSSFIDFLFNLSIATFR